MTFRLVRATKRLLLTALVLMTLSSVASAGATSLSTVTFTGTAPTSLAANTASTWTIGYTSSGTGSLGAGSSVTVTFPSGFTTSTTAPTVTLITPSTFNSTCTATGVDLNQQNVVTINLTTKSGSCALAATTSATLGIGMVNGSAGTYGGTNFTIATSADTTPLSPTSGATITASSVTAATVSTTAPTSLVRAAASTWTWGFTTSSTGSLAAGATIKLTFPTGFTAISTTPAVVLKTPASFPTSCVATALDTSKANVITVTLANNGANTCALASSAAATLSIGVVNGTTDVLSTFSVSTSKDTNSVSPTGTAPTLTSATAPTAVSFTSTAPTSLMANTASVWTVNFNTSSAGALAANGYIVATFPTGFTTRSPTPSVALTLPSTFVTTCTAAGSDPTEANVVIINLANNGANTCALANSTPATLTIAVTNGPAGADAAGAFALSTSRDGTAATAAAGETIIGAGLPGTGSNWTLGSSSLVGEATAATAPSAPSSFAGGSAGSYMCASTASEVVSFSWSSVPNATSYAIFQSSTSGGTYVAASPAPVYSGTTATITYTTAVTEYFKVEALIGTAWVSALSGNATNGSIAPGYVITATTSPECTNN